MTQDPTPNTEVEQQILQDMIREADECACEGMQPLAQWIEEGLENDDNPECRPCALAITIGQYQEVLTENGREDLADEIAAALEVQEGDDILGGVASTLDRVKLRVDNSLRAQLCDLDAEAMAAAEHLHAEDFHSQEEG